MIEFPKKNSGKFSLEFMKIIEQNFKEDLRKF